MTEIKRVLCPVDFSEASRHALDHAVAVARWYEAQILALHVMYVPVLPPPPIFGAAFADMTPAAASMRRIRDGDLRAWLEPALGAGVEVDVIVDEGNPADRIIERANSEAADLIVMGTHGLRRFERFILGSVTERVLRKATCPVMTVPPASVTAARVPYGRLLCPVDFSDSSLAALGLAASLAKEADARLTILHVLDGPSDDEVLVARFDVPRFRRSVEEQSRARLEALVTHEMRTWCKPVTTIGYGKPYRHILETARTEQTDLIVIGIHGRNPLDVMFFGSTTNQIVRGAPCPVLTLKQETGLS